MSLILRLKDKFMTFFFLLKELFIIICCCCCFLILVFYFLNFKIFNSYMHSQTWTENTPKVVFKSTMLCWILINGNFFPWQSKTNKQTKKLTQKQISKNFWQIFEVLNMNSQFKSIFIHTQLFNLVIKRITTITDYMTLIRKFPF